MAGAHIEAEKVRVVGLEVNAVVPESDAAIVVLRGVVDETFGDRARIMPDGPASSGVQREGIVGGGDKHYPVEDDGSDFEAARIADVENPLRTETLHILRGDFGEGAETAARVITVVGDP